MPDYRPPQLGRLIAGPIAAIGVLAAVLTWELEHVGSMLLAFLIAAGGVSVCVIVGRRVRGEIVYLPAARCRHLYNQSAGASDEVAGIYARSEREYLHKWNGQFLASMVKRLERPRVGPASTEIGPAPIHVSAGTVVEASPMPTFESG